MKDMGTKHDKTMYDNPTSGPAVTYPSVDLPLTILEGKDIGKEKEVTITMKAKLTGFQDDKYRSIATFEIKEAEIKGNDKPKNEKQESLY